MLVFQGRKTRESWIMDEGTVVGVALAASGTSQNRKPGRETPAERRRNARLTRAREKKVELELTKKA